MKKMPLFAVATAALLSTAAIAQQTPATTAPRPAPNAQVTPPIGAATLPGATAFVTQQRADQFLASNLIGMKVYGAASENLGEINDLLVDRDGSVMAAIIGVGGFLGVGEKNVAVPFQMVEMTRGSGGDRLVLRKSKDDLKAAPTFAKYTAEPATTGSVSTPRPATTPPAPAPAR